MIILRYSQLLTPPRAEAVNRCTYSKNGLLIQTSGKKTVDLLTLDFQRMTINQRDRLFLLAFAKEEGLVTLIFKISEAHYK